MLLNIIKILLVFSPLITACRETQPEREYHPMQIRTAEAQTENTAPYISGFGTVLYYSKADVYPPAEGYIENIYFEEGDKVNAGDILVKLGKEKLLLQRMEASAAVESRKSLLSLADERLKAGMLEAEQKIIAVKSGEAYLDQKIAELANMERIYAIKKQLYEAGGLSPEELENYKMAFKKASYETASAQNDLDILKCGYRDSDIISAGYPVPQETDKWNEIIKKINTSILTAERNAAESDLNAALAELAIIDLLIKETEIRSPISGIIGKREMEKGEKAEPGTRILTIFDSSKVYLRVEIGELRSLEIRKGNPAAALTDYAEITGAVELISPVINPASRSREIKILADNSNNLFIPGSFAKVSIRTGEDRPCTVIPEAALLRDENTDITSVFIVRNNTLFKKEIDVSFIQDNRAFISYSEGNDGPGADISGEIVCLDPDKRMTDGMRVEIAK